MQNTALDPELLGPLNDFLELMGGHLDLNDIPGTRARSVELFAEILADAPVIEGVESRDLQVPGPDELPAVNVRIYRPEQQGKDLPALLWVHGGGYVLGNIDNDDITAREMTRDTGCIVVSVDYRLAPEHPYPAALEDCYTVLRFLFEHHNELKIDPTRIAVGGYSAGGGLAASLALLARDRAEVEIIFQLLIYPMIDDRNVVPASDEVPDSLLWTRESNLIAWRSYLGHEPGIDNVSPYAAAIRAEDLSNLPPAYIPVGSLDLFLQENIEYARRLIAADVKAELHVYPGAYHTFDKFAPTAAVSQRFFANRNNILIRELFNRE